MGMSASQARLLTITARQNDVELKSQQISNIKMRLASESEQVSQDYVAALSKSKIQYNGYDASGNAVNTKLSASNLASLGYRLEDPNGNDVTSTVSSSANICDLVQSGQFMLSKSAVDKDTNQTVWNDVQISSDVNLAIASDDSDVNKAEAEYNNKTLQINNKEKKLEMELKSLDTEHNALKTEYDSVKSLISKNIEKGFNLFS